MASTTVTSSIFHRSLPKSYPTAVKGDGVYLVTSEGKRIFDGSSGAAVSCLGHGNREVIDAICEQAQDLAFAHTSFFTSDPAEELAHFVLKRSADAFHKILLLSPGSEANESAFKLVRQYHVHNGQPERVYITGRDSSYHGNTLGALAAGSNTLRRAVFEPILSYAFQHVRRCFFQADSSGKSEVEYEDELLAEYEVEFHRLSPQTIAAVVVEPAVGSTLGAVPATQTYLPRLIELYHKYGILVIFDEVMCGMGRTETYHAWQGLGGVTPDLQTVGKAFVSNLMGRKVYDGFAEHSKGPGAFLSGHTFQGHSMACTGALAVQKILARDDLVANCHLMGLKLRDSLKAELPKEFESGGGRLRGLGLFRAVDFGDMGKSFGGLLAPDVAAKCFELGATVYLCSPAVDAILLCPPFIMTESQTVELARILIQGLSGVMTLRRQ
ncbi:pyridoxal phosphate-dependent transferase [Thelonectria olida]|uniref:Pyridoxal phosphate-dependent transferase n=1 Tax=Thelonectria olida TaxID=1576542 RepID=A0A9P8W0V2_9HYPO|nr:pyridoxal phosphate-dependent transferase [Thelonectria olida]